MNPRLKMVCARCGGVLLLLAMSLAPSAMAAEQDEPQISLPTLVTLELRLGETAPIVITVLEGELATIEHAQLNYRLGLVPRLAEVAEGDVDIEVVAPPVHAGEPVGRLYERVRGRVGFTSFTAAGGVALEVVVRSVGNPSFGGRSCSGTAAGKAFGPGPDETAEMMPVGGCCISCQGVTSCGCAVSTACGTCCGCPFC